MNNKIYFKFRIIPFAAIILFNAFYFYETNIIPSEVDALILMTIYLGFIFNGIGIRNPKLKRKEVKK